MKVWLEKNWWIVLLTILIIVPITLGYHYYGSPDLSYIDFIKIVGTAGSLLLTVAIAYIYNQLRSLEKQQHRVQEQQQALIRQNQLPTVVINSWDVDGSSLEFSLTNIGDGPAVDIGYILTLVPLQVEEMPDLDDSSADPAKLTRCPEDDQSYRNILMPGETGQFETVAQVDIDRSDSPLYTSQNLTSFDQAVEKIISENPDSDLINLSLKLQYGNTLENVSPARELVIDVTHRLDEYEESSLEDIIHTGPVGWKDAERSILPKSIPVSHEEYYNEDI